MRVLFKKIFLVLMMGLICSCGYHLRGSITLPSGLKTIYLDGASSELHDRFKKSIGTNDLTLTETSDNAGLIVRVYNEENYRRILSLSAGGAANDFELAYEFNYDVLDNQNNVLAQHQTVSIKREYYNNQQAIIAKDNEELVIKGEMYKQAVVSILNGVKLALDMSKK